MKIKLNEIPEEGREYIINRKTAELNTALHDLIKNAPYEVDLKLRPINSKDFSMFGDVKTHTQEQCSICAEDFDFKVAKKINEVLIPDPGEDRTGKYAKSSIPISEAAEDSLSVTNYKNGVIDLGEFIHEAVALAVPFNPRCEACLKKANLAPFIYDEKMSEETRPSPFESLKNIKLN